MRTFPDALAILTRTAAPRREVGGQKTSPACRPQFSPPLSLVASVGVRLRPICRESRSTAQLATTVLPTSTPGTDSSRSQLVLRLSARVRLTATLARDGMRVAHVTGAIGRSAARLTAVARVAWACNSRRNPYFAYYALRVGAHAR